MCLSLTTKHAQKGEHVLTCRRLNTGNKTHKKIGMENQTDPVGVCHHVVVAKHLGYNINTPTWLLGLCSAYVTFKNRHT